ncbi:hypothetical protein Ocin01_18810 [Orchesella cincta]|uniref:Protein sleepless n=1 Tax=Orchesella cincta TaxID=48709 RepID=A0A1D2M4N8_ORCCI|nr:hypothetical protein Ocin01_18810 [Orchesella cincta]
MRYLRLKMLIVVLPVLLSSLEIQLAEGIKCYTCSECVGTGGEEKSCDPHFDRCAETLNWMIASNKTRTDRFCSDEIFENKHKKIGLMCDDFQPLKNGTVMAKLCFCDADLCNGMLTDPISTTPPPSSSNDASLITGFSTRYQLISSPVSLHSAAFGRGSLAVDRALSSRFVYSSSKFH